MDEEKYSERKVGMSNRNYFSCFELSTPLVCVLVCVGEGVLLMEQDKGVLLMKQGQRHNACKTKLIW